MPNVKIISSIYQKSSLMVYETRPSEYEEVLKTNPNFARAMYPGQFARAPNVEEINFLSSTAQSIPNGAVPGLKSLTKFLLRGNDIAQIESSAFAGLESLLELDLRG